MYVHHAMGHRADRRRGALHKPQVSQTRPDRPDRREPLAWALTAPALAFCERAGIKPRLPAPLQTVAVTQAVIKGDSVEGMRYRASGHFSGWFLATPADPQELQEEDLALVHALHLFEDRPDVSRFLALPAGWRFDTRQRGRAWFDPSLDLSL